MNKHAAKLLMLGLVIVSSLATTFAQEYPSGTWDAPSDLDGTTWEFPTANTRIDLRVASKVNSVPIQQDFIPQGRNNRPGSPLTISFITIHDTDNPNAGADSSNHATYVKSAAAANIPVSWHFTVDDGEIYQHLPLTENGWHAGDGATGTGNRQSIGIEICENIDGNRAQAEENAAWLTAKLLKENNLSISAVKQHNYWSQKNCPHILRARAGGWEGFLEKVTSYSLGASSINSITFSPASGVSKIAGTSLGVEVWVDLTPITTGYLQATMSVLGGVSQRFTSGMKITSTGKGIRVVNLSVTSPTNGTKDYRTFVQFRPGANGPFTDIQPGDTTATIDNYSVRWVDCFDGTVTVQATPANGGTVNGAGEYTAGSQQMISASPNSGSGYIFKSWNDGVTQNPRSVTVVCGGSTYVAMFERQEVTISASAGNGGTIAPAGTFNKSSGESQLFTASPSPNYLVSKWLVDGQVVQNGGNTYTLANIQVKRSVQVTFEKSELTSFVQRQLPAGYVPGISLTVRLQATPSGNTLAYGVEDQPPTGWTVSGINENGGYDSFNNKVKWTFLDGNPRSLTYVITPPANANGKQVFEGSGNLNGTDSTVIGGMTTIDLAAYHPGDVNPSDWSLPLGEVLTYAAGYKRGDTWKIGPHPIPLGYVIRGFLLYKTGERYRVEASVGSAPGWWVPEVARGPSGLGLSADFSVERVSATLAASNNTAVSDLAAQYQPGVPFTVTIVVSPSAGIFAYGVEDQPPRGWVVSGITEGGAFDAANRKVKWTFLDNAVRTLSYQVTPPADALGTVEFRGIANFDGVDEVAITGKRSTTTPAPSYRLEITASNGSVVKSPDGDNYSSGSQVLITASPMAGFRFIGWSGDAGGDENPLTVMMNANKSIEANFVRLDPSAARLVAFRSDSRPFHLRLNGGKGESYRIETSADLRLWSPVATYTIPLVGFIDIDESPATQMLFYRAIPLISSLPGAKNRPGTDSWYLSTPSPMTWIDAQAYARSLGGNLVTLKDKAEESWLSETFTNRFWIGLIRDVDNLASWRWVSGSTSEYRNWNPGIVGTREPNNSNGDEYFAAMDTGYWVDSPSGVGNASYQRFGVVEYVVPSTQVMTNMVQIFPGSFVMGSPDGEQERTGQNEGPQTTVTLTRGFWIGKFEVTQAEYISIMGVNPSFHTGDLNRPVEMVSWSDATNYCGKLTSREAVNMRLPEGFEYRLPTEAEWEYVCRAGTTTRFSFGDDPDYSGLDKFAWYEPNSGKVTHPVGQKLPNQWGIFDVHGNVSEWCLDSYAGPLPGGSVKDFLVADTGINRVNRGGGLAPHGKYLRSAIREWSRMDYRYKALGFRVVLAPRSIGRGAFD